MERHSLDLETALRVLSAVIERREPDPSDVRKLQLFAGLEGSRPADELACEVIQKALAPPVRRPQRLAS